MKTYQLCHQNRTRTVLRNCKELSISNNSEIMFYKVAKILPWTHGFDLEYHSIRPLSIASFTFQYQR